jgi:outer membrane immunogenic protein
MTHHVTLTVPTLSVALLTCTVLSSASALAADVSPVPPQVVPYSTAPVMPYSWTGFYIGAHLGWGWTDFDWMRGNGALVTSSDGSGFLGGLQGGFNYQFAPNWLVGLESQFSLTGIGGEETLRRDINWVTTLGPRFGYTFGSGFVYAKGGVAWVGTDFLASPPLQVSSDSDMKTGWFIGGGIEHVLWNRFSAKIEYNYIGLGSERVTLTGPSGDGTVDVDRPVHIVKVGINYRFGVPAVFAVPY